MPDVGEAVQLRDGDHRRTFSRAVPSSESADGEGGAGNAGLKEPATGDTGWNKRLNVASVAMGRYLWILLVLGLFYWVIQPPADSAEHPASLMIPSLGIPLPASAVWASAPAVLFFVIIVIFGTMRAWGEAEAIIEPAPGDETIDEHPNAIDWAAYAPGSSAQWPKRVRELGYGCYLSLFALEAWYFLVSIPVEPAPLTGRWPLVVIAALEAVVAFAFLTRYWQRAIGGRSGRFDARKWQA